MTTFQSDKGSSCYHIVRLLSANKDTIIAAARSDAGISLHRNINIPIYCNIRVFSTAIHGFTHRRIAADYYIHIADHILGTGRPYLSHSTACHMKIKVSMQCSCKSSLNLLNIPARHGNPAVSGIISTKVRAIYYRLTKIITLIQAACFTLKFYQVFSCIHFPVTVCIMIELRLTRISTLCHNHRCAV